MTYMNISETTLANAGIQRIYVCRLEEEDAEVAKLSKEDLTSLEKQCYYACS